MTYNRLSTALAQILIKIRSRTWTWHLSLTMTVMVNIQLVWQFIRVSRVTSM